MSFTLDSPSVESSRQGIGQQAAALRHEAARWARARHPGVAELVDITEDGETVSLTIRQPGGPSLAEAALTGHQAAGALAVVATTVADLHDVGVTVGRLDPATIRLGADGRPVLCDLSGGALLRGPNRDWPTSDEARTDVVGLGRLGVSLTATLTDETAAALRALAERACDQAAAPLRGGRLGAAARRVVSDAPLTARRLAEAVIVSVPAARLPAETGSDHAADPVRSAIAEPARVSWAGIAITIVLLATAWWWFAPAASTHRPAAAPASPAGARAASRRPSQSSTSPPRDSTMRFAGGVLHVGDRSYAVGEPDDVLAAGRWLCTPLRTVALLRPSSGDVFVFGSWPEAGVPVTARLVGHIGGATALRPIARGACDALSVVRPGGPDVVLRPWAG